MANLIGQQRSRGQLLIVSAFALGVLFVALALILNSAIFTENLASRGETTGGDQAVEFRDTLQRGVGNILTAENENITDSSTSYSTLRTRVGNETTAMGTTLIEQNARGGATSDVNITDQTNGSLIRQSVSTRNFSDNSGNSNWTVAQNVDQTRAFTLNVSRSELSSNCTPLSDCFVLNVTNWRVSMNSSTVAVETPAGDTDTCSAGSGDHTVIDINAGTVNGTSCPALDFSDAPQSGYDIEYQNGDEIGGTYSLVVDDTTLPSSNLSSSVGSDPSATPALYDVRVEYDYQTAELNFSSAVRVAPGETDD
jgi:hypothetical protein